jgi:hypothetical protein
LQKDGTPSDDGLTSPFSLNCIASKEQRLTQHA